MKIKHIFTREFEPDFVSKQIMKKDLCDYSHVLMTFSGKVNKEILPFILDADPHYIEGDEIIFHSTGDGVNLMAYDDFFKDHHAVHIFETELKCSKEYFFGFVRGMLDRSYAYDQIMAMAVNTESDNDNERVVCSELDGLVLTEMCGYHIDGDQDTWRPYHCYKSLKTNNIIGG